MKVGIDVDGTITKYPELFRILTQGLRKEGHHVHIVTCRLEPDITQEELVRHGISYDRLHMPTPENDNLSAGEWKRMVCDEEKLDILFDDSPDIIVRTSGHTQGIFVL